MQSHGRRHERDFRGRLRDSIVGCSLQGRRPDCNSRIVTYSVFVRFGSAKKSSCEAYFISLRFGSNVSLFLERLIRLEAVLLTIITVSLGGGPTPRVYPGCTYTPGTSGSRALARAGPNGIAVLGPSEHHPAGADPRMSSTGPASDAKTAAKLRERLEMETGSEMNTVSPPRLVLLTHSPSATRGHYQVITLFNCTVQPPQHARNRTVFLCLFTKFQN